MTNTNTSKGAAAKASSSKAPETAWDYSSSLLAGFYKAAVVANEEYAAAVAVGNGNPFAPGISQPHQLLLVLSNAKLQLEGEMRRIARSSGLTMPELPEE
jgi:hypothetical protein